MAAHNFSFAPKFQKYLIFLPNILHFGSKNFLTKILWQVFQQPKI